MNNRLALSLKPLAAAVMALATLLFSPRADALVINIIGPDGGQFDSAFGPALSGAPGVTQADLMAIAVVAGDVWERLVDSPVPRTIDIQVGFSGRLGGGLAGTIGGIPSSIAAIGFTADPNLPWFVDPTPLDNSEYATLITAFADLGGGSLNTIANLTDATGAAVDKFDLFSVALHEIGHAIGLSPLFGVLQGDDPIGILDPLPFAGSQLPFDGTHLVSGGLDALMDCCFRRGDRNLPSDADILAVAQAGGFTEVNLSFAAVPEPATALLLGAALLFVRRRLR